LQFITSSTYRRVPIFSQPDYCALLVQALSAARARLHFALIGWVLMPDHFHILIRPTPAAQT
jgi:REP element-mobilizing transposase RayT